MVQLLIRNKHRQFIFDRLFPQGKCNFASRFSFMYTVRGYSHPDLAPQVVKSTNTNPSRDDDEDPHYYPPTPPSSTSPKLTTTTTKQLPPTPPPVVAPSQGLSSLFKTPTTKTHAKLEWHPLPKFAGIDHSEPRINVSRKSTIIIYLCHTHMCHSYANQQTKRMQNMDQGHHGVETTIAFMVGHGRMHDIGSNLVKRRTRVHHVPLDAYDRFICVDHGHLSKHHEYQ